MSASRYLYCRLLTKRLPRIVGERVVFGLVEVFRSGSLSAESCSNCSSYNRMVFRPWAAVLLAIVVLAGCRNGLQDREKVQEAIVSRLQTSTGLDLKTINVTTTSVRFDKNLAYATVAFHPKDDPTISNAMTMKYTLKERNGKWTVVNVADSQGHGLSGHGAAGGNSLPAGHPPVDSAQHGAMPNAHITPQSGGSPNGQVR